MTGTFPTHRRTEGRAVASLAFGLLGFVFPILPSVVAIWLGVAARRAIRDDPSLEGDWMATAGLILGIGELVLVALSVLALVLIFGIAVHMSHGSQTVQVVSTSVTAP